MKYNCRNFWEYYNKDKTPKWFEGFEAELREMHNEDVENHDSGWFYIIEEILGE